MPEQWYITDYEGNILSYNTNYVQDNNINTSILLDLEYYYAIVNDFGEPTTITSIAVYAIFEPILVQYWTGSAWAEIGVAEPDQWVYFTNLNIQTTKWRVCPYGYEAYVAEMQRTIASSTTKTYSDSGQGSDALRLNKTVTVTQSGTGTDTLNRIMAVKTYSDSGSGTDALSQTTVTVKTYTDSGSGTDNLNLQTSSSNKVTTGTFKIYDGLDNFLSTTNLVSDENLSTYVTLYAPNSEGMPFSIVHELPSQMTLTTLRVYRTGSGLPLFIQVWSDNNWQTVGTFMGTTGWLSVTGSWATTKWRVVLAGWAYGTTYICEMEAYTATPATTKTCSDTGTGTDYLRKQIALSESGQGTDIAAITYRVVTLMDSGQGLEGMGTPRLVFDTATLQDAIASGRKFLDYASATDLVHSYYRGLFFDFALTLDYLNVTAQNLVGDTGQGLDKLELKLKVTEQGQGLELQQIRLRVADTGRFTDAYRLIVTLSDLGQGYENWFLLVAGSYFLFVKK